MRRLGWLAIGCGLACGPQVDDADGDGDASASESDASADDSASQTSSATVDGGADTGVVPDGLYVHCDELGPGEPTVGGGDPSPLGFPTYACNPRVPIEGGDFQCCSSDPATADGQLPAYEGKGISGSTPLYADAANDAGTWGMCVHGPLPRSVLPQQPLELHRRLRSDEQLSLVRAAVARISSRHAMDRRGGDLQRVRV